MARMLRRCANSIILYLSQKLCKQSPGTSTKGRSQCVDVGHFWVTLDREVGVAPVFPSTDFTHGFSA